MLLSPCSQHHLPYLRRELLTFTAYLRAGPLPSGTHFLCILVSRDPLPASKKKQWQKDSLLQWSNLIWVALLWEIKALWLWTPCLSFCLVLSGPHLFNGFLSEDIPASTGWEAGTSWTGRHSDAGLTIHSYGQEPPVNLTPPTACVWKIIILCYHSSWKKV